MPFELTNALNTFMKLINKVLMEYIGKFVIIYLDYILIFSGTKAENLKHLDMVLKKLHKEKLTINLEKYELLTQELVYLVFLVS